MEECFRWYGPDDPVPLSHIRQAGTTGIVSALHHVYDGSDDQILKHKALMDAAELRSGDTRTGCGRRASTGHR